MGRRLSGNGGGGGALRAKTINAKVPLVTGLLTTVSSFGLLAPVTFARTGGNANLTLASNGQISATAALAAGATQSISGTATGADGVVLPFTANLTGIGQYVPPPTITSSDGEAVSLVSDGPDNYNVIVAGSVIGTVTKAQIDAGGWITLSSPVTAFNANVISLTSPGFVLYPGDLGIETKVEVFADGAVVSSSLPFDASAYAASALEVLFTFAVGSDTLKIKNVIRAYTPANLFALGEQGFWYDPSDMSSMFQDAAGMTPVTAVGQPVGRINDKSGRGNHGTQTASASRPILRQDGSGNFYLEFDGVDDYLQMTPRLWEAGGCLIVMGIRGPAQIDKRVYGEGNSTDSTPIYSPVQTSAAAVESGARLGAYIRDTTERVGASSTSITVASTFDNTNKVISTSDTGTNITLRTNRQAVAATYVRGTMTLNRAALGCLLRGTPGSFFAGRIYGVVARGGASIDGQRLKTEEWLAAMTGVTLP